MNYIPGSNSLHECLGISDERMLELVASIDLAIIPLCLHPNVSPTMLYEAAAPFLQTTEEGFFGSALISAKMQELKNKQRSEFLKKVHIK